jgi:hypothetical protein
VGVIDEGQELDNEFDQEILAGGKEGRKQLSSLSPEERAEEIR